MDRTEEEFTREQRTATIETHRAFVEALNRTELGRAELAQAKHITAALLTVALRIEERGGDLNVTLFALLEEVGLLRAGLAPDDDGEGADGGL